MKGSCVLCELEMFYFSSLPVLEGVSLVWFFSNRPREGLKSRVLLWVNMLWIDAQL